ncbi:MAG: 4Fe-4S dicluster domain-containing protein [Actinobacteria bacterium]|nr:4Fe-4S dicluster domain-containing protein [Actinomycetota bacterium]
MLVSRVIEVGDAGPAESVRGFLEQFFRQGQVDRLFAPVMSAGEAFQVRVVEAGEFGSISALTPRMTENGAAALRLALRAEPKARFVAVLRPCELRAVVELAKRDQIALDHLVAVGIDCLSTYEQAYADAGGARRRTDPDWLTRDALRLAKSGQLAPAGTRLACQLCDRPAPDYRAADIMIGLVGVDTDEKILVLAEEDDDARFGLGSLTTRPATERESVEREVTLWRLMERRKEAADRVLEQLGLADAYPGIISGYMHKCTLCGDCIDACPQSAETLPAALKQGRDKFIDTLLNESLRMASCSGCGMCQAHCPEGIPLCAISRALSRQIQQRMHYVPGRDVKEPLPWSN